MEKCVQLLKNSRKFIFYLFPDAMFSYDVSPLQQTFENIFIILIENIYKYAEQEGTRKKMKKISFRKENP